MGGVKEHSNFLLTTAEIAIAFAGFASIVSILGRQHSLGGQLLRIMLEASLTVVIFFRVRDAFGGAIH